MGETETSEIAERREGSKINAANRTNNPKPSVKQSNTELETQEALLDKSENVIDCKNSYSSVLSAINAAINDGEFKSRISKMKNPNGDGFASSRIANILSKIDFKNFEVKKDSRYLKSD